MLKLKGNILPNWNNLFRQTQKYIYIKKTDANQKLDQDYDLFGKSNKFYELDTGSKKRHNFISTKQIESLSKTSNDDSHPNEEDTFGTLTNEYKSISFKTSITTSKPLSESIEYDAEDEKNELKFEKVLNHIRLSNDPNRPHTDNYYAHRMKTFAEEGKITEAISVFYDEMIERDRYRPTLWLYKALMKILARAGYTHMVFALFKKLTDSGDDDWNSGFKSSYLQKIITVLFLACSNCKWKEYSVQKTDSIRFYLKNRNITPNNKMYSAMILSYGKSGAIYEAFNAVDEMLMNKIKPDVDIFANLMCACISNKNLGSKYALNVWQLCLKANLKPNLTMYNLLLKATNDCSLGLESSNYRLKKLKSKIEPVELTSEKNTSEFGLLTNRPAPISSKEFSTLEQQPQQSNQKETDCSQNILQVRPDQVHVIEDLQVIGKSLNTQISNLEWWQDVKSNICAVDLLKDMSKHKPELNDLLSTLNYRSILTHKTPNFEKDLIEKIEEDSPQNRFKALGGIDGIIRSMRVHKVDPDFKSFNMMLQMIPDNLESEELLIKVMKFYKQRPELDFINILMKRRRLRKDMLNYDKAFELIQEYQLSPNIYTFGVIAYNINKVHSLKVYLDDLKNIGFELNPIIISTLFCNGFYAKSAAFLKHLCLYIRENNFKINYNNLKRMEYLMNDSKEKIIKFEKSNSTNSSEVENYNKLKSFYTSFKPFYSEWLKTVQVEEEDHPYKKFARENDKLYYSFMKRTQKFEQNTKI